MTANFGFDKQAAAFDQRAGLPPEAAQSIAAAILDAGESPGTILDLGAGTGEIGWELAQGICQRSLPQQSSKRRVFASQNRSQRYLGLDLSLSMLGIFRHKLAGTPPPGVTLLRADAERPWPVRAGSISNFFFSRSAHLLNPEHLVAEVLRTAAPTGSLLTVGRVRRQENSVRSQMRRRMQRALHERGVEGKAGEAARKRLLATLDERGGQSLRTERVASWPCRERPAQSLDAWSKKAGLAGLPLPVALRREVLSEVKTWAEERWDSLDTVYESTEHYELSVVRLKAATRNE